MNSSSAVWPSRNFVGLGVEVVELALEDRDDVPRDVLVDLGVLERAAALGAGQLLRACRLMAPSVLAPVARREDEQM